MVNFATEMLVNFDRNLQPDQIETSFSVDKEDNAIYLSLFGAQIPQEEKQMWASNERIYF